MTISIALATYNGEKYLQKQLQSFSAQTLLPDELIVSDDNSSDKTISVLESFALNAPFEVKIFQNESNLGFTRNFEKAIEKCSGDIIFLSDQDDFWFPEKIEKMANRFKNENKLQLLSCDVEFTDGYLNPTGKTKFENFQRLGISLDNFVAGCASAFRKKILDIYLPIPSPWNYDDWLHAICRTMGARGTENSTLQYYRRHGENTSESYVNLTEGTIRLRFQMFISNFIAKSPLESDYQKVYSLHKRLKESEQFFPGYHLSEKIKELEDETKLLKRRNEIVKKSLFTRWIHALNMYFKNEYKNYKLYSALKDSFLN